MKTYYPEMGEPRPDAEIEARIGHRGGWFITTPLALKGRGIKHLGTLTADQLTPEGQRKVGWHDYRVTDTAMERLQATHTISLAMLL